MISKVAAEELGGIAQPTVWGLKPAQVHDRFWAARGVQVVRLGEMTPLVEGARWFLLTTPRLLVTFKLGWLTDMMSWPKQKLVFVRLRDGRERGYRELAVSDDHQRFLKFQRVYEYTDTRVARVSVTSDPAIARLWQTATDPRCGWRRLREQVASLRRVSASIPGRIFNADVDQEVMECVRGLIEEWNAPDTTVSRAKRFGGSVWADEEAQVDHAARFVGPVWIGAGRRVEGEACVVGPAVLWDAPAARPSAEALKLSDAALAAPVPLLPPDRPRAPTPSHPTGRRSFDVACALLGLLVTLPLYPLILLAIWLEDGGPFFFTHWRETLGGRRFPCWKFRSMRKDAPKLALALRARNQADGPQFHMDDDPRLTRVGRFLRRTNLDEIPQFFNVICGHMSIVGPRPSPYDENQFCPAWREARLSVRPGITGLWQVERTRRQGLDFQEWIKFDLEYVENASWALDLWILWRTFHLLVLKRLGL